MIEEEKRREERKNIKLLEKYILFWIEELFFKKNFQTQKPIKKNKF